MSRASRRPYGRADEATGRKVGRPHRWREREGTVGSRSYLDPPTLGVSWLDYPTLPAVRLPDRAPRLEGPGIGSQFKTHSFSRLKSPLCARPTRPEHFGSSFVYVLHPSRHHRSSRAPPLQRHETPHPGAPTTPPFSASLLPAAAPGPTSRPKVVAPRRLWHQRRAGLPERARRGWRESFEFRGARERGR